MNTQAEAARTIAIPHLTPGLRIAPAEENPGEHRLIGKDGKAIRLPDRLVAILLQCDGTRSTWEVAARLSAHPATPPVQPELVEKLVTQLAPHGICTLERAPVPVTTRAPARGLRFDCLMCGRSCEGHTIGPLSPERAEQIARDHARLARDIPALAAHAPLRVLEQHGERIVALNVVDGRCVFLDPDKRCLLHAHLGPDAKPSICQRFPLQAVSTEDAIRVGIQPGCYRLNRVFESAPELDVAALAERPFGTRPPAGPQASSVEHAMARADETQLLALVAEPDMSLAELWHRLAGQPAAHPARQAVPQAFAAAVGRLLARTATRLGTEAATPTGHAEAVAALVEAIGRLAPAEARCELALPEGHWRFVRFVVEQGLFLREAGRHLPPRIAAVALVLGATVARWLEPPQEELPIDAHDAFAERIAAWNRTFLQPALWSALFDGPHELDALLTTLAD